MPASEWVRERGQVHIHGPLIINIILFHILPSLFPFKLWGNLSVMEKWCSCRSRVLITTTPSSTLFLVPLHIIFFGRGRHHPSDRLLVTWRFFLSPFTPSRIVFCPFLSSSAWSSHRALRESYNEDFDTWCMTPGINKWQECRTISKVSMARLSREIRVAFQGMASHWSASYTSRRQQHSVYVFVPFSSLSLSYRQCLSLRYFQSSSVVAGHDERDPSTFLKVL